MWLMSIYVRGLVTNIKQGSTAFLKSQYVDGMTKVCFYNVMGSDRSIRLDSSTALCPFTSDFNGESLRPYGAERIRDYLLLIELPSNSIFSII